MEKELQRCSSQLGQVRLGQVRLGQVRLGQVRLDQVGQVRLGQVRLGQVRLGQVRLGQVRLGQVRLGNTAIEHYVLTVHFFLQKTKACCVVSVHFVEMLLSCYYECRHNKATHALLVPRNEFQIDDVRIDGSQELIQKMAEMDDTVRHASVVGIAKKKKKQHFGRVLYIIEFVHMVLTL